MIGSSHTGLPTSYPHPIRIRLHRVVYHLLHSPAAARGERIERFIVVGASIRVESDATTFELIDCVMMLNDGGNLVEETDNSHFCVVN